MIVENIFSDRSDRINFCAEIMHRNFPPPNLCNLRPLLTIMLGRGWLPIPSVEVSRERPLVAESGPYFHAFSSSLNVRFLEKRTLVTGYRIASQLL